MHFHHDAAHARPTADWITRYASDLLASTPGMHPLDAVRLAMEATPGPADPGHERPPSNGTMHPPTGRRSVS